MAIPWLIALKVIPWGTVLAQAPAIARAAETLLSSVKVRPAAAVSASELQTLADRVAILERRDQAVAELLKQVTSQVEALTTVTEVLAARVRWLMVVGIVSSALAVLALGIAVAVAG